MLVKRMLWRVLMNEAGGIDTGGAPTAAAAPSDPAPAPTAAPADPAAALTPPASLLADDTPADPANPDDPKPGDEPKPVDPKPDDKPVEYAEFTLPEGFEANAEQLDAFKKIAGDAKLPQEVAQSLIDLYTAQVKEQAEAPYKAWKQLQDQWQAEIKADPEIGGKNLEANLAATKAGLNALLGKDAKAFYEALSITGAGNNPAIIRGLVKAAAPHAPATPINGSPGRGNAKSAGQTLYPNMAGLGNGYEG